MKIKRYLADSLPEAMQEIKRELGNDAMIISTRRWKEGGVFGLFGRWRVEVVVAQEEKERPLPEKTPAASKAVHEIARASQRLEQAKLDAIVDEPITFQYEVKEKEPVEKKLKKEDALLESMLHCGIEEEVAKLILNRGIKGQRTNVTLETVLLEALGEPVKISIPEDREGPVVIGFVGPTGVGKTTTVAKLAANFSLVEEYEVGLLTLDTYRVAAVEQLNAFAKIINIPLEVIYNFADLSQGIRNLSDKDLILIDTPGRSQFDALKLSEMAAAWENSKLNQTHLVMASGTRFSDALSIFKAYKLFEPTALLFTKTDETKDLSLIPSLSVYTNLPLSYLSTGQDVPEDIALAETEVVVKWLLEGNCKKPQDNRGRRQI